MITSDYVQRALTGVFRLSLHDPKGLTWFEITVDGFFRSFWAIALSAPFYAYALMGMMRAAQSLPDIDGQTTTLMLFLIAHCLNFIVGSVLFLAAMAPLSKLLDLQPRYAAFAIVYNWGTLALSIISAVPVLAYGLGLLSAADSLAFGLVAMGFGLYLRFASFSVSLGAPWPVALALAIVDSLLQWAWWLFLRSQI